MKFKLVFNMTFHHQIEPLIFHLSKLLTWDLALEVDFVFSSAHRNNLKEAELFVRSNYPDVRAHYVFVSEDLGYHKGTFENIRRGINYIREFLEYDYIVNIEADNMFWDEKKFTKIMKLVISNEKHLLLIPEGHMASGIFTNVFRNNWPDNPVVQPNLAHITTLNIYSKYFIDNYMPLDIYEKYYDVGWCGQEGTPFEAYFVMCINDKLGLDTPQRQLDFYTSIGQKLEYDFTRIVYPGWYLPDQLVPDKFIKWGIVNCPCTSGGRQHGPWEPVVEFIRLHEGIVE